MWRTTFFVWLVLLTPCASAADVMLSPALRSELLTLKPIEGELAASGLERRVVVINFFASWCPPCRTEFQHLNTLTAEFGDAIRVVAINVFELWDDYDALRLQRFLEDLNPSFAVVEGTPAIKEKFGDVQRIPTVFVFDATGRASLHFIHERGSQKMTVGIEALRAAILAGLSP